jgi:hypothetical protein
VVGRALSGMIGRYRVVRPSRCPCGGGLGRYGERQQNGAWQSEQRLPRSAMSVSFLITGSNTRWLTAEDVLEPNALGFMAAAHLFACANPCRRTEGAVAVGFATVAASAGAARDVTLAGE